MPTRPHDAHVMTVGILADDMTGAADTALQFFKAGHDTQLVLPNANGQFPPKPSAQATTWSISTDSRYSEPHHAIAAVTEGVQYLTQTLGVEHLYKKMDSTLRGHFAPECLAVLDALDWDAAIIVPAYPHEDRRTVGGYQLVHGIPVEQTDVARDAVMPVEYSHIPSLMETMVDDPATVGHVHLGVVLSGAGPISGAIQQQVKQGRRLIVIDACTDTDLNQIALALTKLQYSLRLLPCGSAGLAQALSRFWSAPDDDEDLQTIPTETAGLGRVCHVPPELPPGPVVILAGSMTDLTREQCHALMQDPAYGLPHAHLSVAELTPDALFDDTAFASWMSTVVNTLQTTPTLLISAALTPALVQRIQAAALQKGLTPSQLTQHIQQVFQRIAQHLTKASLERQLPIYWIVTGGETAKSVCQALGCDTLTLAYPVEPTIPILQANTGTWLISKSGNFGSPEAFIHCVRYLRQHHPFLKPA